MSTEAAIFQKLIFNSFIKTIRKELDDIGYIPETKPESELFALKVKRRKILCDICVGFGIVILIVYAVEYSAELIRVIVKDIMQSVRIFGSSYFLCILRAYR